MKKILSILLIFMAVGMSAAAQQRFDSGRLSKSKAFKRDMEQTMQTQERAVGAYYHVTLSKPSATKEELEEYCKENKFHVVNVKVEEFTKFGDVAEFVTSFDFLLEEQFTDYNFEIGCDMKASPRNGEKAMLYYWENGDQAFHLQEVIWTGKVVGGKADGNGSGFFRKGELYCYLGGAYEAGIPAGKVTFQQYEKGKKDKIRRQSWHLGPNDCGLAKFWKEDENTFHFVALEELNFSAGRVGYAFGDAFNADAFVAPFSATNGAYAVIMRGGEEHKINKKGEDLGITDNQKKRNAELAAQKREEDWRFVQKMLAEKVWDDCISEHHADLLERMFGASRVSHYVDDSQLKQFYKAYKLCEQYSDDERFANAADLIYDKGLQSQEVYKASVKEYQSKYRDAEAFPYESSSNTFSSSRSSSSSASSSSSSTSSSSKIDRITRVVEPTERATCSFFDGADYRLDGGRVYLESRGDDYLVWRLLKNNDGTTVGYILVTGLLETNEFFKTREEFYNYILKKYSKY